MRAVRRNRDRAGFVAIGHARRIAQCQAGLIEGVELLEEQHHQRLAEIERRFAGGTEQVARKEGGHPDAGAGKIGRRHHAQRFERAAQPRKIDAGEDMRRVSRADQ